MKVELTILLEKGEDGFWVATIPEVPGAFSQGRTKAQARRNVAGALLDLAMAQPALDRIVAKLVVQA